MTNDDIKALYEQYSHWIFNRAKGLLKNEERAWEATQDVFVKVMQHGDKFRGESSPWTWLYRITTNHCLNLIRSHKNWMKAFEGITSEQIVLRSLEENIESVLTNRQSFVKLLEPEDELTQQIVFHYFVDHMTQDEITEVLGISRKTIYKDRKSTRLNSSH